MKFKIRYTVSFIVQYLNYIRRVYLYIRYEDGVHFVNVIITKEEDPGDIINPVLIGLEYGKVNHTTHLKLNKYCYDK